jgi:hypothetical protein
LFTVISSGIEGASTAAGWCWAIMPEEMFGQLLGLGKAWRVVGARLGASSSTFVLKKRRNGWVVTGRECPNRDHGDLARPCRADAMAAPQRFQQGVHDRLCALPRGAVATTAGCTVSLRPGTVAARYPCGESFNYPQVPDVKNPEKFEKLIYNRFNLL